jgi:predicted DNA-binding protein YlxM (UPF0122 family)
MGKKIEIPEAELRELYLEQKLSATQIAERYGCSVTPIYRQLHALGIAVRAYAESTLARFNINLAEEELRELYIHRRLTMKEIADLKGCSEGTIRNRLLALGILIRSKSEANLVWRGTIDRYLDFNGNGSEKAYLIGFRFGDLTATKFARASGVITITGRSSRSEQIEFIQQLFSPYSEPYIYDGIQQGRKTRMIRYALSPSFEFLLEKSDHVPSWILSNFEYFIAFFSGLVEAEGSFQVRHPKDKTPLGSFFIGMTDKRIIAECRERLIGLGLRCAKLQLMYRAGRVNKQGITARKDYWGFHILAKDALLQLIELLSPYIKHAKRQADMLSVRENIEWRNSEAFKTEVKNRSRQGGRQKVAMTEPDLRRLYWEEGLSTIAIAKIYSCTSATIKNRMNEFRIVRRPAGGKPKQRSVSIE